MADNRLTRAVLNPQVESDNRAVNAPTSVNRGPKTRLSIDVNAQVDDNRAVIDAGSRLAVQIDNRPPLSLGRLSIAAENNRCTQNVFASRLGRHSRKPHRTLEV